MDPPETFLQDVRLHLAEVPDALLKDEVIVTELQRVNIVLDPWRVTNDKLMKQCIIALADYFCYVSYTSLAERAYGSLPATATIRLQELKNIAYMFCRQIAPFTSQLILYEPPGTPISHGTLESVITE